jgi:cobalt-zinc-cadmium efflux system outer membrane protein
MQHSGRLLVLLMAFMPWGLVASAHEVGPLELTPLLLEARTHHPGLLSAKLAWQAAQARVGGQGLLPDPMLQASLMNILRLQGPQVSVSQSFPLGGKLALQREMAEREAIVARYAYLVEVNKTLGDVKMAYYDLYAAQQTEAIVETTHGLAGNLSRIATSRYGVGLGKQVDPLRANLHVADVLHEAVQARQIREAVATRLTGLLARAPGNTITPPGQAHVELALGSPRQLPQVLAQANLHNPALAKARAEVRLAETARDLASTITTPDVDAQVGIGEVFMDQGWQTALSGMVGVNLPYPNGQRRKDAAVSAALQTLAAKQADVADQTRIIDARSLELVLGLGHLAEQIQIDRRAVLPQARQALAAEIANYQVGKSDYDALLNAQTDVYRFERDTAVAVADYAKMRSELETLTGQEVAAEEANP